MPTKPRTIVPKQADKQQSTTDELVAKRQPQAVELERSVLGGLLIEPNVFGEIAEMLKPSSFYDPKHQLIYEAISDLAQQSLPIDYLTVTERLKAKGQLEQAGGAEFISQLALDVASAAHIEYHASIIADKSLARRLISMGLEIAENAFDETADIEALMNNAESSIFEITQSTQKQDVQPVSDVISDAIERLKRSADKSNGGITGVPSGFDKLDKVTSGWQGSDLIIIAARPAMGKTAFVLSMAKNMGVAGHPVAIFSLEMSKIQLVNRLFMNVCSIEGSKFRSGKLSTEDWSILDEHLSTLQNAPIYIDDTPGLSIFELRSKARRLVHERGVECIIIDYLQLMSAGQKMQSRELEVSMISRSLKGLAMELKIPIIALSQLNRSLEGRAGVEGKVPQLSDLRESGAIEQDADMVCFIHRYDYFYRNGERSEGYDPAEVGKGHIIIAKHRNGATTDVRLRFENIYARFDNEEDLAEQYATGATAEGYRYQSKIEVKEQYNPNPPF